MRGRGVARPPCLPSEGGSVPLGASAPLGLAAPLGAGAPLGGGIPADAQTVALALAPCIVTTPSAPPRRVSYAVVVQAGAAFREVTVNRQRHPLSQWAHNRKCGGKEVCVRARGAPSPRRACGALAHARVGQHNTHARVG